MYQWDLLAFKIFPTLKFGTTGKDESDINFQLQVDDLGRNGRHMNEQVMYMRFKDYFI